MLSESENQRFTQIGPGTPMGDLLRRYWQPIAATAELDEVPVKPVKLLGEELTLYKDLSGRYGLVDRYCMHRRADLSYGFVDENGLRCNYHGWQYNEAGRCVAQPFEDKTNPEARFKDKITIKAYQVKPLAGLIWAYLGPEPVPVLPNWEPFTWDKGFVQIVFAEVPCNWFQCQENSIDPVHFEWMHANWAKSMQGNVKSSEDYAPTHIKLEFKEFDYGFTYHRIREDTDENNPLWTIGRACLWPNCFFLGDHFEWRVPIDDENTLSVGWFFTPVPKESWPYKQERIPYWYGEIKDPETGRWISSHVMNQDFIAWAGQGTIADRTKEHLGRSDRGISMIRKRLREDMECIVDGKDPKGVIRETDENGYVELPIGRREMFRDGVTRKQIEDFRARTGFRLGMADFPFQYGQPDDVKQEYMAALGINEDDSWVD